MKLRENDYDAANRVFTISRDGIKVGGLTSAVLNHEKKFDGSVG